MAKGISLFGFTIGREGVVQNQPESQPSFALPTQALEDGAVTITSNAHYGTYVDLEGSVRNEMELITRYREMSNHPELEMAIDEIVNEAITRDEFGKIVDINLDKLQQPDSIKKKITEEFNYILKLLNFKNLADDLFKRWYIDGRLFYHVLVDEQNPKEGIQELRYIDPRKIRKVREINRDKDAKTGAMIIKSIAEYYVYSERGSTTQTYTASVNQGVRIAQDAILNVNSGMMDAKNTFVISYLHKCIAGNQKIRTNNGWKFIRDIVESDIVYSYDINKDIFEETKVVNQWKTGNREVIKIRTNHTELVCTPDHPILTKDNTGKIDYVFAGDLTINKHSVRLFNIEDPSLEDWDIMTHWEFLEEPEDVFEIEVENHNHNFVVNNMVVKNCIKPLNQLRMMEDAAVIYRLSRSPERRIFYIDVGNLPKGKAEQYMQSVMVKYRNKMVYDACLSLDTKIPLLDGRTLTLSEIIEEYNSGKTLWAYSCDHITGKFAPGIISWAGVTKKDQKVMKLTLDNGEEIVCTPEHKHVTRKNGLVMAKDLKIGDSLMPFYSRQQQVNQKYNSEYLQVFENDSEKWQFVHRLVSRWKDSLNIDNEFVFKEEYKDYKKTTVHHKNFNRYDNSPENLVRMNFQDHITYHGESIPTEKRIEMGKKGGKRAAELGKSQEAYAIGREKLKELMKDPEWNAEFREKQKEGWTQEKHNIASNHAKSRGLGKDTGVRTKELYKNPEHCARHTKKYRTEYTEEMYSLFKQFATPNASTREIFTNINNTANMDAWKELNDSKVGVQKDWSKLVKEDILRIVNNLGFKSIIEYKESLKHYNHKITAIEYLDDTMDVGTLTIDREEKYHNYHTFAISAGIYTKNSNGEMRDERKHLSFQEDYFLPRREGGKGTEITTLPGGGDLGSVDYVIYFQKALYNALNVPISRLQPQDGGMIGVGRSTEVTRDEVKFSKFIQRLRIKFSRLFDDALGVQLALKGICTREEWEDFKEDIFYDYKKDNNFTELRDSELLRERLTTLGMIDPYIGKYYSMEWVKKYVCQQNQEEMEVLQKEMEDEQEAGLTSLTQDQLAQQQAQNQQFDPSEYPPEDNGVDRDSTESQSPSLDSAVNKYSKYLQK